MEELGKPASCGITVESPGSVDEESGHGPARSDRSDQLAENVIDE
jgi:hypothetical protein